MSETSPPPAVLVLGADSIKLFIICIAGMCVVLFYAGQKTAFGAVGANHLDECVERFKKNVVSLKDYLDTETYQKVEFSKHILDTNPFIHGVFFMTEKVYFYNTRKEAVTPALVHGDQAKAKNIYDSLSDGWNEPVYDPYLATRTKAIIHYSIADRTAKTDIPYKIGFTIPFHQTN